jgi:large subunit ribosomal protein L7/L12
MTPGAALWSGREDHHCCTAAASVECRLSKGENDMATKAERLTALEKKQAQIQKQIQALKARDTAQERKNDTRRKILLGGVVLKLVKDGQLQQMQVNEWLDATLSAERNRMFFGLAAKAALSPDGSMVKQ